MRAIAAFLVPTLLAATLPFTALSTDPSGCFVSTSPNAISVGPLYVQGVGSYWEESNGLPGLQMRASGCDGWSIPADQCIFLSEGFPASADCAIDAAERKTSGL